MILLILCQGLLFINNTTMIAVNGLVRARAFGHTLATIPVTSYVIGSGHRLGAGGA